MGQHVIVGVGGVGRGVARELAACAEGLARDGYEVRLELWSPEDGKAIDDLLATGKRPEVVAGSEVPVALAQIVGPAEATPADGEVNPSLNNLLRHGLRPIYERENWAWSPAGS